MMLELNTISQFQQTINSFYRKNKRSFPWRETTNPYLILVSEIMLQQTQTDRVKPKYVAFIKQFPTIQKLAQASLKEVLTLWQGLGYNRRALYLHQAAKRIITDYHGTIPTTINELTNLPGIGPGTAGAIITYACNQSVIFIETNIRSVFLHFFFQGKTNVADKEIMPLIEQTLDRNNPRDWYYALTDYGAMLKSKKQFRNTASKHYTKQSTFEGSNRQVRGAIIRMLTKNSSALPKLLTSLRIEEKKVTAILDQLQQDGLVVNKNSQYHISA